MKNTPTTSDIARKLHLSRKTVSAALNGYKDVAPKTAAIVKATASAMGYNKEAAIAHGERKKGGRQTKIFDTPLMEPTRTEFEGMTKRPTYEDVARESGFSKGTVRNILSPNSKERAKYAQETVDHVQKTAERIGWANQGTEKYRKIGEAIDAERKYLQNSNFRSKHEERQRMLNLRSQGYTNRLIAKKVGCSYNKVLDWIGCQPDEFTMESHKLQGQRMVLERKARERLGLSQKIAQFETFRKEAEAIDAKAKELELQAQRIADEAKAVREQYSAKVVELDAYRKEAEKAAAKLGRTLA